MNKPLCILATASLCSAQAVLYQIANSSCEDVPVLYNLPRLSVYNVAVTIVFCLHDASACSGLYMRWAVFNNLLLLDACTTFYVNEFVGHLCGKQTATFKYV